MDRREIRRRITHLKEELEGVRAHRQRHRMQRNRAGIPTVALVGYTNAGKSTLLNALSGADVYVANQLFATLDPTTRRIELPNGRAVLLSDTVGFIQKLPVTLVAAFRATLEEVVEADLLLHVVDISDPHAWDQIDVVEDTLAELDATRIPKILVLNKIDRGEQALPPALEGLGYRAVVRTSALKGRGLEELREAIGQALSETLVEMTLLIPYAQGDVLSTVHEMGVVENETHTERGVEVTVRVPPRAVGRLEAFRLADEAGEDV